MQNAAQTLAAIVNELDAQVVAKVGSFEYTRAELSALFDRVADADHWKNPIDAVVDVAGDRELVGIFQAVEFFTGSKPTAQAVRGGTLPGCRYRIKAAGYFATCGA
jgi:hypothetical protein